MRVSLRPPSEPRSALAAAGPEPLPLLDPRGPELLLGSRFEGFDLTQPVRPTAATLFGPRGAALAGGEGPHFVTDTGHHRLLIWRGLPSRHNQPADLVLGQANMACRDENGGCGVDARGVLWPHSATVLDDRLFIADSGYNRVMLWRRAS